MKAKDKKTGEIVEVYHESQHGQMGLVYKEAVFVNGRMWSEDELEFIDTPKDNREHPVPKDAVREYLEVGAAFQMKEIEPKLQKLKKLADAMYHAAQYLTTDASHLRKAMDEYHQFVIQNKI